MKTKNTNYYISITTLNNDLICCAIHIIFLLLLTITL